MVTRIATATAIAVKEISELLLIQWFLQLYPLIHCRCSQF
jgi:hypothetical protein